MTDAARPPAAVTGTGPAADHPLAPVLPLLGDTLVAIADEAAHPMVVTDAQGRVLWGGGRHRAGPDHPHHSWSCAARPVHHPETGGVIGAVDVTGPARRFHPTTFELVAAAARLAEGHLAVQFAVRDERPVARDPRGPVPPARRTVPAR